MQNFLWRVIGDTVYPKDIWYGDTEYSRLFGMGIRKYRGANFPMTLALKVWLRETNLTLLETARDKDDYKPEIVF